MGPFDLSLYLVSPENEVPSEREIAVPSRVKQALVIRLTLGVILAVNVIVLAGVRGPVVVHSTVGSVLLETTVVVFEIIDESLIIASILMV